MDSIYEGSSSPWCGERAHQSWRVSSLTHSQKPRMFGRSGGFGAPSWGHSPPAHRNSPVSAGRDSVPTRKPRTGIGLSHLVYLANWTFLRPVLVFCSLLPTRAGVGKLFLKRVSTYFRLWAMWSLVRLLDSAIVAGKQPETVQERVRVPVKLHLQTQALGGSGPWAVVCRPLH